MFERFTDQARQPIVLAQEEARLLNHSYIGTDHILLGLIREGERVAAKVASRRSWASPTPGTTGRPLRGRWWWS
jgi:ATP-dependent Clp protease ATP-binding subunit ClpA